MMNFKPIIQSMRGPFLVLTPVCVFLGVSTAVANQATVNFQLLALALLGALLAHISVNTFNEYLDFKSGLDLETTRTPFSGGSGALPGNPGAAGAVFAVGGLSLIAMLSIGIFFVRHSGMGIIPIGAAGLVLITTYTGWINTRPLLCLIALLPVPLAFFAWSGAMKHGENIGSHPQYMAANVAVTLLTPLLLGVSLMFG